MTPGSFARHASGLGAAAGIDVTGGMLSKVTGMLSLIEKIPDLEVLIFSGEQAGNLTDALRGQNPGTRLHC
jgi:isopentenyl phosphate kinase